MTKEKISAFDQSKRIKIYNFLKIFSQNILQYFYFFFLSPLSIAFFILSKSFCYILTSIKNVCKAMQFIHLI